MVSRIKPVRGQRSRPNSAMNRLNLKDDTLRVGQKVRPRRVAPGQCDSGEYARAVLNARCVVNIPVITAM